MTRTRVSLLLAAAVVASSFVERPERLYLGKTICVKGRISLGETPRILVTDRGQISIP